MTNRNGPPSGGRPPAPSAVYPHMTGLDGGWPRLQRKGRVYHRDSQPRTACRADGVGAVDRWRLAHERHGRLAWSELLVDAIRFARTGAHDVFLPGERIPREGERLVSPDLADAFEVLARHGFYEGQLAQKLCGSVSESLLKPDDSANSSASWVDLSFADRGAWLASSTSAGAVRVVVGHAVRPVLGNPLDIAQTWWVRADVWSCAHDTGYVGGIRRL